MNILLTGASGFIGQALLPQLLRNGHQVTLLSRQPTKELPPPVAEIIADALQWAAAVRGKHFDTCIHLAWIATPGIYLESPENDVIATATAELANELYAAGLPHFLGLGSCIEYAPLQSLTCNADQTPINPQSSYGVAKEKAKASIAKSSLMHRSGYSWARLFYPYGPGEHRARIPSTFLLSLAKKQPINLKTPHSIKDWIYIDDVVQALMLIIQAGPQSAINLGTGIGISISEVARVAAELTGTTDNNLIRYDDPLGVDPYSHHVADAAKLRALGWVPAHAVTDGMKFLHDNLFTT